MFIQTQTPSDRLIKELCSILTDASQILLDEYQRYILGKDFDIHKKTDNSPVTQADLKVNHFIEQALSDLFVSYPLISEENSHEQRHEWNRCWMLDPLDGTKEFLHQSGEFTINLSLIEQGKTIFSVLVVPCKECMYLGYVTERPYKYDFKNQQWWGYQKQEMSHHIEQEHLLDESVANSKIEHVLNIGVSHRSKATSYQAFLAYLEQNKNYKVQQKQAGSAYKFCMMLEGEVDLYPRLHPTSEWDTSAGQGLLESIGGGLVSLKGQPFLYNQRATLLNEGFIAYVEPEFKWLALDALEKLKITNL